MRVLWLSHFVPYPPQGGALQRSFHLMSRAARDHDVDVLALNQRAILDTPTKVAEAILALKQLGVNTTVFPIPADRSRLHWAMMAAATAIQSTPYDVNWLRSRRFAEAVSSACTVAYDAIHVDSIGLIPYLPREVLHKTVLNHHNVESHMLFRRASQEASRWRRQYISREAVKLAHLEAATCPAVGLNVVVSRLDGERLQELAPNSRIHVVENGVDVDYFTPGPAARSGARSLVFAGSMGWYPNANAMTFFLQDVWPMLLSKDPEYRLSIVGHNPPPSLRTLAGGLPNVTVTGSVPDVRPHLERAAVYVCPILDGGGTRLKVLDALSMQRALVATPLAVEGLGLVPGRHFMPAATPAEFVESILSLRDDPAKRDALGRAGREFVEGHFSWSLIAGRLSEAYRLVQA